MKTTVLLWVLTVSYAITATWAINTYWRHDLLMKRVMIAPIAILVICMLVHALFEDQIWDLRHKLSRWRALRRGPPPPQDVVTVHLPSNRLTDASDERWDVYALQEQLRDVLKTNKMGSFDGNEFGEEEAVLFMFGPNGEAIFQSIEPILRACPLCRGGLVRITPSGHDSLEREVRLD